MLASRLTRNLRISSNILMSNLSTAVKRREMPPPITLTENAAARIKEMMENKEEAVGIRLSVKRRGCNGYSYIMNYANRDDPQLTKDDKIDSHGVKVFVDPKAVFFLVGTQMDFEETELASEFTFTNPNSKGTCGCGESFNV
jgi:iron-sulfur cluster assembly protein